MISKRIPSIIVLLMSKSTEGPITFKSLGFVLGTVLQTE